MGNGGISQQSLDVLLLHSQQVAHNHGCNCNNRKNCHRQRVMLEIDGQSKTQQYSKHSDFRSGSDKGGNGSWRSLVHISGPKVKRYQRQLKANGYNHYTNTSDEQGGLPRRTGYIFRNSGELHTSCIHVD